MPTISLKTPIPGPNSQKILDRRTAAISQGNGKLTPIAIAHAEGATVTGWDPEAMETTQKFSGLGEGFTYGEDMYSCLDEAEVLIIATEWPQFANADLEEIKKRMRTPLIFDGRNLFDPVNMKAAGIEYHSIGREAV